ncbi:hypothetical protein EYC80_001386 [Monilinia laxa]|uniref:Uncharacterized protein n=1 Tax=Monilinia laxa TaxID=61186 RepID=A0A5N6KA29_MONLA|nr:hypothetical protein EYC80_001386 [Monilinia laxa]
MLALHRKHVSWTDIARVEQLDEPKKMPLLDYIRLEELNRGDKAKGNEGIEDLIVNEASEVGDDGSIKVAIRKLLKFPALIIKQQLRIME